MLPVVIIIAGIGALLIGGAVQRRWLPLRRVGSGLLVSYITVLLMLGAGEVYLRCCFAESENIITLATDNWLNRYWQTNSWGFRDREWTPEDWTGKQTVVVLGDSFAAGWGIENPADRFSDVLAVQLGDEWAVMNAAVYGSGTVEQLDTLKSFTVQEPDVVILQYFLNDINYTGLKLGLLPNPEVIPDWARESYLGNFLYWRLLRPADASDNLYRRWWQWSYDAYDNAGIWNVHQQEIEDFIDYVESIGARLIVVIFPNMVDIVNSVPYVDRVAQVFEARGHNDVLKLFDEAAGWPSDDLMVSRRDSHPSVNFHHHVGEMLYEGYFVGG